MKSSSSTEVNLLHASGLLIYPRKHGKISGYHVFKVVLKKEFVNVTDPQQGLANVVG